MTLTRRWPSQSTTRPSRSSTTAFLCKWRLALLTLSAAAHWVCVCVCRYLPQDGSLQSETVHFKRGVCQQFCLPSHTVNLSEWADDEVGSALPPLFAAFLSSSPSLVSSQLVFDVDKEIFPMVIQAAVAEGEGDFFYVH